MFINKNMPDKPNAQSAFDHIPKSEVIQILKLVKKKYSIANQSKLTTIIEYFEEIQVPLIEDMTKALNSNCGQLVFAENK